MQRNLYFSSETTISSHLKFLSRIVNATQEDKINTVAQCEGVLVIFST
jgi:hypothetical protein